MRSLVRRRHRHHLRHLRPEHRLHLRRERLLRDHRAHLRQLPVLSIQLPVHPRLLPPPHVRRPTPAHVFPSSSSCCNCSIRSSTSRRNPGARTRAATFPSTAARTTSDTDTPSANATNFNASCCASVNRTGTAFVYPVTTPLPPP